MNNDFLRFIKNNYPNNYISSFFPILNKILEKNDINQFRALISQNKSYIKAGLLELVLFFLTKDQKDSNINNSFPNYISILLSFGLDPNSIIEDSSSKYSSKNSENINLFSKGKSLLMLACEKSWYNLVKDLYEINKMKLLNINHFDKDGRNCLFYLKGGNEDHNIIEYLVNKDIEVNRRDREENTVLNYLIINTTSVKLIYDFIKLASPLFHIKNQQGKNSLDLINERWVIRKNNNVVANYDDIKKLINLIKSKLSINKNNINAHSLNNTSNKINENIINNINVNNNNLIKLSSLPTMTTEKELDPIPNSKPIQKSNSNDIYIKFPRLSLIIDTDFNDNDKTLSTQKKIDYLNQTNKNKKYLLTLLKSSEFKIIEQTKFIQEEILKKKNKLKEMKVQLEKKSNLLKSNDDYEQNLDSIKSRINKGKEIIEEKKQNLFQEQKDLIINIPKESKSLYKYSLLLNLDIKKELVYSQLKLDLIDFMNYVHARNAKLESTLQKINSLIEKSVLESLGKEYQLHMYGSRATKLCLPWSDIDYVISYTKNNYIDPLKILYDYLYTIPERFFIDMKYIPGASIPVLKIFTNNEYHKISLDISMENQEHHGEECVNYIKNKIKEFEVLTPITFALKTILQKAFLNDPYKGGLSSYGVILLIINFLNVQNKRGNDITMNSLGKLFYDILYYYGFEHDVSNPIILDDKTDLDKVYFFHQFQIYKKEFILVDPLNIANNVAKNTRQYQNIKLAFKIGYVSFLESCECGCHYQYDGINIKEEGCEHNLLVRIFNDVKRE